MTAIIKQSQRFEVYITVLLNIKKIQNNEITRIYQGQAFILIARTSSGLNYHKMLLLDIAVTILNRTRNIKLCQVPSGLHTDQFSSSMFILFIHGGVWGLYFYVKTLNYIQWKKFLLSGQDPGCITLWFSLMVVTIMPMQWI